jgi:NACalpha-BTF3-like transcription factor
MNRRRDAELLGVDAELVTDAERAHDERRAALAFDDEAQRLQLHERLAQPEGGEDPAPATVDRPADDVALVPEQERVDRSSATSKPVLCSKRTLSRRNSS